MKSSLKEIIKIIIILIVSASIGYLVGTNLKNIFTKEESIVVETTQQEQSEQELSGKESQDDRLNDNNDDETDSGTTKVYTLQEVATHNMRNDCWIVIEGKVYDVTGFDTIHPGGAEGILSGCGTDVTFAFKNINEGVGHTTAADSLLETFYIGDLDE